MRKDFKACFNEIGQRHVGLQVELVKEAAQFMQLNNTVILSVRCVPFWWKKALVSLIVVAVAMRIVFDQK